MIKNKDEQITVRFDKETRKKINKAATDEGLTRASWIRRLVILALKELK